MIARGVVQIQGLELVQLSRHGAGTLEETRSAIALQGLARGHDAPDNGWR